MANKYGKNGEAGAAFLDEVSATDLPGWRAFLELAPVSDELIAAVEAAIAAPLSASARSSETKPWPDSPAPSVGQD